MSDHPQIVYVREADPRFLPEEAAGSDAKFFALHDAESGRQLAVTDDRRLAFALARSHDMTAVSVH